MGRSIISILLLFAASQKIWSAKLPFATDPDVYLAGFELLLAAMLVSMATSIVVSAIGFVTFVVFASYSVLRMFTGYTTCGCLGNQIALHPIVSWIVSAISAIVLFRDVQILRSLPGTRTSRSQCASAIAIFVLGLVAIVFSVPTGTRLSGKIVEVVKSENGSNLLSVRAKITNQSSNLVTIISMKPSCSCITADPSVLPRQVNANESVVLDLLMRTDTGELPLNQHVDFFLKGKSLTKVAVPISR